ERIAQDNLLLPDSGADLALMDKLADKAVATGNGTDGFPYFQGCKAMSQFRLGHFSEALDWAEKAAQSSAPFAHAKRYAVLATATRSLQWHIRSSVTRTKLATLWRRETYWLRGCRRTLTVLISENHGSLG